MDGRIDSVGVDRGVGGAEEARLVANDSSPAASASKRLKMPVSGPRRGRR